MKILLFLIFSISVKNLLCEEETVASEKCGGTFTGLQYPIISPNYPDDYPPDQDCVYLLKGSQSAKCEPEFHLQFLDFQLEASKGCGKDYLKVGTGGIYCGNSIGIRRFKGQDKSLKLIFHSDTNTTSRGFRILVTTLPCGDEQTDSKPINDSVSVSRGDLVVEGTVKNSYPVFRPELKFIAEDEAKENQLKIEPPSPKNPSEKLELPEFAQHDFHDENCGHDHSVNDERIGSITSYLYLPPAPINRPLKITGAKNTPSNVSPEIIPGELVIGNFEERKHFSEPPTDFLVPSSRIPPAFASQVLRKARPTLQATSQFFDPTNRWLTYGTPNYAPHGNPSTPNNNFDPFASNNDNNGNNPGVNYNPVATNCAGNGNNPTYYPSNGNNNPNYNPGENFSPGPNVNVNYPNFGNGNGYPEAGNNFGVNGNNNPGYFVPANGNYYPSNNFYSPSGTTYYDTGVNQCCGTIYSSSNFVLASPGFPALIYSGSNYECQYTIRRSSESVCGLQMYLKFFNFGSDDQFCAYGYIEVDGSRICGCKTGANVTSSFDNIATKTITVKYLGYPRNKFSGFVIEVTQVACSTSFLRFGNDQPNQDAIFIRNYQRNYKRSLSGDVGEEKGSNSREKRDAEYLSPHAPTNAALRTSQNLLLNTCRIFKFVNWVKAAKQVYLRSAQCSGLGTGTGTTTTTSTGVISAISVLPIFPDNGNAAIINYPPSSNCETVNFVDGTISSPYYPNGYSNNLNQCYRFYKAPGYCQLELAILDFDLENSVLCRKDYVSFSGQKRRYCGSSLAGTRTIFDMSQATFADVYFVTDSSGTGRGFRAGFTQISC